MSLTVEAKREIERLLKSGRKADAIRYIQDTFKVSAEDATVLAEAAEREMEPAIKTDSTFVSPHMLSAEEKKQIENFIRTNQKIQAVKYVRSRKRTSLKKALNLVEEVQKEIDPEFVPHRTTGGCLSGGLQVTAIFLFLGALMMLGGAALNYYLNTESLKNSQMATGTVVSMEPYADGGESVAPIIAYQWQGREMTYHSKTFSYPPAYHTGEKVEIFVNTENPEDVFINSFSDRWLVITILSSIGGFMLLIAITFWVLSRKLR